MTTGVERRAIGRRVSHGARWTLSLRSLSAVMTWSTFFIFLRAIVHTHVHPTRAHARGMRKKHETIHHMHRTHANQLVRSELHSTGRWRGGYLSRGAQRKQAPSL